MFICNRFGLWAQICTKMCFILGGMLVGGLVLFGGGWGHLTWPWTFLIFVGLFLVFVFFVCFVFFCLFCFCLLFENKTNLFFPWGMGILVYFWVSSFFSLAFFFSLSLSLSLYLFIFSFFLSSFLVFFLSFLLPCFCRISFLPGFFAFVLWNEEPQNSKLERFLSFILSVFVSEGSPHLILKPSIF